MRNNRIAFACLLVGVGGFAASGWAKPKWQLGVQTYTFRNFTLFEAIDKTKALGLNCVEGFAWQKVSPKHGDVKFDADAPKEVLAAVKKKLVESKVKMPNCYAQLPNDEAKLRKIFAFAKDMGIKTIVSEPPAEALPLIDKTANEYGVNVAIHNHPKNPGKPEYNNWDPDKVIKMLEPYSKRIGTCADTGHWVRSGVDPVKALRTYKERLISVHVKDVQERTRKSRDVPWGTGKANAKGIMAELDRQGFSGVFAIEYEHNPKDNMAEVAQIVKYFNQVAAELGRAGGTTTQVGKKAEK